MAVAPAASGNPSQASRAQPSARPSPPTGNSLAVKPSRLQELRTRIREDGDLFSKFAQQTSASLPATAAALPSSLDIPGSPALEDEKEVRLSALGPLTASEREPLVDSFGREHTYLRISLTERCNLRCTYCMPAEGVTLQPKGHLLTTDEILRLVEVFAGLGVTKVRLTGGEPMVRKDIALLTRSLRALGIQELAITTNGVAPRNRYEELVAAGMTHFNVSLDTLQFDRFAAISRRPGRFLETVLGNVALLADAAGGGGRVKLNNVVMRGANDDEIPDFVGLTAGQRLDVRFIEWMPFDSNGWNSGTFLPYAEMTARLQESFPTVVRAVDGPHDTTKWWQVPGHRGRVGFITSMSQHFCGTCNRLRITADGKLKVCLFGAEDLSLRDALRAGGTNKEMAGMIGKAVGLKKFSLGGRADMFALAGSKNRPMVLIGG